MQNDRGYNMHATRKLLWSAIMVATSATWIPQASAEKREEMTGLEEVVVTARKREESLQDTPIAVSALSGESLKDAGATNLSNIAGSVPGLNLENGAGSGGAAAPRIRGVGQGDTKETLEAGVAIYMDGLYMGRPDGALLDLLDVQSVQVLRGPQGTLFGKNSTGGALVITTNKPTDRFEGSVMLRAGNYNRQDAQLIVNVPLTDTLFSRVALSQVRRDGYSKQVDPATDITIAHWDDEDRLYGYGQVRWLASDSVTVDVAGSWGKQRERGRGNGCMFILDDSPWLAKKDFGLFGGPALPSIVSILSGTSYQKACDLSGNLGKDQFTSGIVGRYENKLGTLSTTVNWDIGSYGAFDSLGFKSITAWRYVDTIQNMDVDGTVLPLIDRTNPNPRDSSEYTQEFQLNFSAADNRLKGVTGLFLYNEGTDHANLDNHIGPFKLNPDFISAILGVPPGIYDAYWYTNRAESAKTGDDMAALYSQVTWSVNDIISVTGGLRYNWEHKKLTVSYHENAVVPGYSTLSADDCMPELSSGSCVTPRDIANGIPLGSLFPALPPGFTAGGLLPKGTIFFVPQSSGENINQVVQPYHWLGTSSDDKIFRSWTPMLSIQANSPQDVLDAWNLKTGMGYFTYSRGFKSGGLVAEGIMKLGPYQPENVDNYEIGFKLDTRDSRFRFNAAAFYMDYTDIQVTVATSDPMDPVNVRIKQSNAGAAQISGVEFESVWLPTNNLLLQFNATYTDARYSSYVYQFTAANFSSLKFDRANYGETFPQVPTWTAYLAAQYSFFTDFGVVTPRLDVVHENDRSGHFDFLSYLSGQWNIPEHTTLNARLIWDLPDDRTRITAWINNIENHRYLNGGNPIPEITGGGTYSVSPPRMYGVDLEYRF